MNDNSQDTAGRPLFRVIVAGSRDFADYSKLRAVCDNLLEDKRQTHDIVIVSGGAQGTDSLGEEYARERDYDVKRFPADWERFGRAAGPVRNAVMADNADALIAFWDGKSRGTRNMIDTAGKKGLVIRTVMV